MDLGTLIAKLREVLAKVNSGDADFWVILSAVSAVIQFVLQFSPAQDGKITFGRFDDEVLEGQLVSVCGELCAALGAGAETEPVFKGMLFDRLGQEALAALVRAMQSWLAANGLDSILDVLSRLLKDTA